GAALAALRTSPRTQLAPADLPALAAYAVTHLAVNLALVSGVIGLATRTRAWDVALANYRGLFVPIIALYPLGVLMSVTYIHFGGWVGLLLLAVPTVAVYSALNRAQQLRAHTRAALETLADALDRRDRYTAEHSRRVAEYVDGIARVLGLPLAEREVVVAAARVHDLGKISTPDAILRKEAPLDDAEWQVMREHPGVGAAILSHLPMYREHARLVESHHERLDGDGYPRRVASGALPLGAQVLAVADAYDAMTSDRPYRRALPPVVALERLRAASGTQFSADAVEALTRALGYSASPAGETHTLALAPAP
ncbi:MAG TPA: HD-GYP domain-containing protein, partial [Chloroflexota bacterium]|nr:HD-GYP domain-containing protein [Chloroflexota bacterium]